MCPPDDDPTPRSWSLCGDPVGAGEDQSTSRRPDPVRVRFPLEGLTPGQMRKHRRNCVILAALAGGAPTAWTAEAFGLTDKAVRIIRANYREKFYSPQSEDD